MLFLRPPVGERLHGAEEQRALLVTAGFQHVRGLRTGVREAQVADVDVVAHVCVLRGGVFEAWSWLGRERGAYSWAQFTAPLRITYHQPMKRMPMKISISMNKKARSASSP